MSQKSVILSNTHLRILAEARYHRVAESLGISLQQVQHLKDLVLTLDPKPGRNFFHHQMIHNILPPDAVSRKGWWRIYNNHE